MFDLFNCRRADVMRSRQVWTKWLDKPCRRILDSRSEAIVDCDRPIGTELQQSSRLRSKAETSQAATSDLFALTDVWKNELLRSWRCVSSLSACRQEEHRDRWRRRWRRWCPSRRAVQVKALQTTEASAGGAVNHTIILDITPFSTFVIESLTREMDIDDLRTVLAVTSA